ncbi:CapA family protein [Halomicrococcus sp. SG-WS-1]|uniref:CapA family protein n=1 Tax=Halomicrococcus sp. SG-WS-1 TaxID=3439057 RepID=UPI003F795783
MVRLGFTGDVMLGRLVDEHQRRRPEDAVWGDVVDRLRALDGLFVNLECCLSTRGTPWTETNRAFHFRADPDWAVPALEAAGVDYASLANNHVLDYGRPALFDTLASLDDAGIAHAGAGEDESAAREPAVVAVEDRTVAVVAFTDNTPEYAAGPEKPGTARVEFDADDRETRRAVGDALSRARDADPDLLVASLHWGPNMREEPPPEFRSFARWLADEGVDLVHGHSAHVFHGVEVVDGTVVLYDTGDFVDDYAVDSDLHNDRSFLFEVSVEDGEIDELRLFPTEIYDYAVHEAGSAAADWSRRRMRRLSAAMGTEFEREGEELVLEP